MMARPLVKTTQKKGWAVKSSNDRTPTARPFPTARELHAPALLSWRVESTLRTVSILLARGHDAVTWILQKKLATPLLEMLNGSRGPALRSCSTLSPVSSGIMDGRPFQYVTQSSTYTSIYIVTM